MYSLILNLNVIDKDDEIIDHTTWPVVYDGPFGWHRGMEGTKGQLFNVLSEVIKKHDDLVRLLSNSTDTERSTVPLWKSISNTRGAVENGTPHRLKFDLQIVCHIPVVLQTTQLDICKG